MIQHCRRTDNKGLKSSPQDVIYASDVVDIMWGRSGTTVQVELRINTSEYNGL
jgi:hypothetical protein